MFCKSGMYYMLTDYKAKYSFYLEGAINYCTLCFSNSPSNWALDCGGGAISSCVDPEEPQLFSITSSVTFIDIPINTRPPKTRCLIQQKQFLYQIPFKD